LLRTLAISSIKMKKKLFLYCAAIILLFLGSAYVSSNGAVPEQAIRSEVAEAPVLPAISENINDTDNLTSANQTITLKNPTFQELKDFILGDPTSRNKFVLDKYECRHFATDVDNNAEDSGLRCAIALLCYETGQHAVVAFDTVDRGLVYIEPQTDAVIHPEVGGRYQGKEIKEILIAW
jgi:hypothetical protein